MKLCRVCNIQKDLNEFYKQNHNNMCRGCHRIKRLNHLNKYPGKRYEYKRRAELKNKYGMSEEDYEFLLSVQNYKCKICKSDSASKGRKKRFSIDHDHRSGHVRGLLCDKCNRGLGLFGDNIQNLVNAKIYLEYHEIYQQYGIRTDKVLRVPGTEGLSGSRKRIGEKVRISEFKDEELSASAGVEKPKR